MCTGSMHRSLNGLVDPFSTFHLLRTYNRLVGPVDLAQYYNSLASIKDPQSSSLYAIPNKPHQGLVDGVFHGGNGRNQHLVSQLQADNIISRSHFQPIPMSSTTCPTISPPPPPPHCSSSALLLNVDDNSSHFGAEHSQHSALRLQIPAASSTVDPSSHHVLFNPDGGIRVDVHSPDDAGDYSCLISRRQRGEKRPIPDEQKDDKYFERRKRNNEAAKKSRDARKMREDRIAFRAAVLEQENAILRTQMLALRDEVSTLRQMICTARPPLNQPQQGGG